MRITTKTVFYAYAVNWRGFACWRDWRVDRIGNYGARWCQLPGKRGYFAYRGAICCGPVAFELWWHRHWPL